MLSVLPFKVDLISVNCLTRDLSCLVTFFSSWCILLDLAMRRTIGLGKQRVELYCFIALAMKQFVTKPSSPNNRLAYNLTISSTNIWHNRLGHASPSRLSFIAKTFLNFSVESNNACLICPLVNQCRFPFSNNVISSTKPFEMIHCYIWGSYRHLSYIGAYSFLTIVDDYTRFTWIFLCNTKMKHNLFLKCFFSYVSTQFERRIKTF